MRRIVYRQWVVDVDDGNDDDETASKYFLYLKVYCGRRTYPICEYLLDEMCGIFGGRLEFGFEESYRRGWLYANPQKDIDWSDNNLQARHVSIN